MTLTCNLWSESRRASKSERFGCLTTFRGRLQVVVVHRFDSHSERSRLGDTDEQQRKGYSRTPE